MVLAVLPKAKESLASDLKNVARLEAVSIVSLVDEIRPNIEKVLSHFAERSIHLKIVSGDAPETVRSVAEGPDGGKILIEWSQGKSLTK